MTVLLWLAAVVPARAQSDSEPEVDALILLGPRADLATWGPRLTALQGGRALVSDPQAWVAARSGGLARKRLEPLGRIEALLIQARNEAAALAEDQALATLSTAARIGEQLGDVPGAAAWNAEIQLQMAVTAAQAGLDELAEAALRRAASLLR